jgi:hypothetical protein
MGHRDQRVYSGLRKYLAAEHLDKKKKEFDFEGWEDFWDDDTPQQENGCDCGVFTVRSLPLRDGGLSISFCLRWAVSIYGIAQSRRSTVRLWSTTDAVVSSLSQECSSYR